MARIVLKEQEEYGKDGAKGAGGVESCYMRKPQLTPTDPDLSREKTTLKLQTWKS